MAVKQIMAEILAEIEKFPELMAAFKNLSDYGKYKLVSALKTMNRDMLYESPIHGAYHSEKVTLFCILLGERLGCTEKEIDILVDAAMYHDFMRDSDNEDSVHGLSAAINLERVVKKIKYSCNEWNMLKSIIDYHSVEEKNRNYDFIAENNDVCNDDIERGRLLANILKDADSLDRCRFSQDSNAYLKPEFLHFDESRDLVKLSEEVNEAYIGRMFTEAEILSNQFLYRNCSPCLHSVGKNFFRINSVLEHGLLSYSRFSQLDSSFQRNFDGGNSDKWISVVPCNKIRKDRGAAKEFLTHGVVFMFDEIQLFYPDKKVTSSYARSYGLPYTKNSGYVDEQYAYDFIPKEKIVGICLDENFAEQRLFGLNHYVYDSFNYDLFERNVISYLEKIDGLDDGKIPSELEVYMNKYKDITMRAENSSLLLQDMFAEEMMKVSKIVNLYIGRALEDYYRKKIDLPEDTPITVRNAVEYELSISNYDYERAGDTYLVTPKEDVKGKGTYL